MALKGDAADLVFAEQNANKLSFTAICEVLEGRYSIYTRVAQDKKALRSRKKKKDEYWSQLGHDISKLTHRIYTNAPEVAARESNDCFLRALPDQLRIAVAADNPLTLKECIQNVTQTCAMLDIEEKEVPKRVNFANDSSQNQNQVQINNQPSQSNPNFRR